MKHSNVHTSSACPGHSTCRCWQLARLSYEVALPSCLLPRPCLASQAGQAGSKYSPIRAVLAERQILQGQKRSCDSCLLSASSSKSSFLTPSCRQTGETLKMTYALNRTRAIHERTILFVPLFLLSRDVRILCQCAQSNNLQLFICYP